MNSQAVSKVFRTSDRTRTSCGSSKGLALGFAAAAGAALMVGASPASAGGSAWGISVGVASGGSYIGGSYAQGYRGGYAGGGYGYRGGGYGYRGGAYARGGFCAPIARPYCAPIAAPYCAPVARPYYGGYARGYYPGFRPYCAPAFYGPAYLPPPVVVAPATTYYSDAPAISLGVGVAGSGGAGYFSYASAPAVTTVYPTATYASQVVAPAPVVYSSPTNVTYVNPAPATQQQQQTVQYASQQTQPVQQAPQVQQSQQPSTVFHASGVAGTMQRNASAATIIREMTATTGDARAQCAEMYLGKTPSQAWGVTFEGVQETGGVKEIRCRAVETLDNGYSPTIIVRGAGDAKAPPQQMRGMVTGRVASITVDDPAYPGGLIVLEDSWVKW